MNLSIMKRLSIGHYCKLMLILSICSLYFFCLVIVLIPAITESNALNLFTFEKNEFNFENYNENDSKRILASKLYQNDQKLHFNQRKLQNHLVIKDRLFNQKQVPFNHRNITLDDIFISVKTTRIFHKSRLDIILDTWYQLAKNQVNILF